MKNNKKFSTLAVNLGEEMFPLRALSEPIFQSSTFVFKNSAELKKYLKGDKSFYFYTRYANPTLKFVEKKMASLEGGEVSTGHLLRNGGDFHCTSGLGFLRKRDNQHLSNLWRHLPPFHRTFPQIGNQSSLCGLGGFGED